MTNKLQPEIINMLIRSIKLVPPLAWDGNRRSGVALAMHHRQWFIYLYGLNGLRHGDDNPESRLRNDLYCVEWDVKL